MFDFRAATPDDVGAVVALVQAAYRGEPSREGWTTEADWIDGVRTSAAEVGAIITAPDSLILLVEAPPPGADDGAENSQTENRQSGFLASCQLARAADEVAYFGMFAVRPDQQGRGTGSALLAEAERWAAAEWGARTMRMTVIDVRAELIAWYERRGYRRNGETEPFPYGDPAFGVPKVPGLFFSVLTKPLPTPSPK